jgi:hypothetical protein
LLSGRFGEVAAGELDLQPDDDLLDMGCGAAGVAGRGCWSVRPIGHSDGVEVTVDGGAQRIVLLTLGWMDLPKSVSVHGAGDAEVLREPVPGILVQTGGGWLLIDTGCNTALIRDPALRRRFYPRPLEQPILPGPGEPLEEELAQVAADLDHRRQRSVLMVEPESGVLATGITPGSLPG